MPIRITHYEQTPNPNALKCWLESPISEVPRSFLNAGMSRKDPLARRLFDEAGINTLLINGKWMTINKHADDRWPNVKRTVETILQDFDADELRKLDSPPPSS